MRKISGNCIIYEFVAIYNENPNLYHERQYKRSKWADMDWTIDQMIRFLKKEKVKNLEEEENQDE